MAFDRSGGYATEDVTSDIYADLARAYVPPGVLRGEFTVLDARRVEVLTAWVSGLIPGEREWPSAADVGSVEYIDQNLALAPRLRPVVLLLTDRADALAAGEHGQPFANLAADDQHAIMAACEQSETMSTAFLLVKELVYEAYYRDPEVLRVVERRTGFRPRLAIDGFKVPEYDDVFALLTDIAERPSLVREVTAG